MAKSINITAMKIRVNDVIFNKAVVAEGISPPIHELKTVENLKESHTPSTIEKIETIWATSPFLKPFISAGIKQMIIIMSRKFINFLKVICISDLCLYNRSSLGIVKINFAIFAV